VNLVGHAGHPHPIDRAANSKSKAQSLVELALIMPLLVGIVAVLFQFGVLFVAYLSIVHETRDIGRYVAVHPDTVDTGVSTGASCATVAAGSLWKQVCDDAPSVLDKTRVTPTFSPACGPTLTAGKCPSRTSGTMMTVTLNYNASGANIFLPTTFRLGPWLNVAIPTSLPSYTYYVMVETH
jgi:Flp pilus assembly protein TadG